MWRGAGNRGRDRLGLGGWAIAIAGMPLGGRVSARGVELPAQPSQPRASRLRGGHARARPVRAGIGLDLAPKSGSQKRGGEGGEEKKKEKEGEKEKGKRGEKRGGDF